MNKDLHLALDAAQGAAQELTLTSLVAGLFARLAEAPRDLEHLRVIREIPGYAYLVPDVLKEAMTCLYRPPWPRKLSSPTSSPGHWWTASGVGRGRRVDRH